MTNEDLVREIQQGNNTTENLEKLYLNNKGYIYKIAIRYKGYCEIEDLMQEAYFGLYDAVERFKDARETSFITYAAYWIRQAISRYVENNCKTVRIPVHQLNQIHKYKRIVNDFKTSLNREPTDSELSKALKISFKQLEDLRRAVHCFDQLQSLDSPLKSSEGEEMTLKDSVADSSNVENSVIDSIMQENVQELWQIVDRECNEKENKAIVCRYRKGLTLKNTGELMQINTEAVRQWEQKALRKLRYPRVAREIREKFEINNARSFNGGFGGFKNRWGSITEDIAIRNLELERDLLKIE